MVDFTYNRIYINNDGVADSGKIKDLGEHILGIFNEKGEAVTDATAGDAKYLKFAQGNSENKALQSDEIYENKVIHARLVEGNEEVQQLEGEIEFVGDMYCGETVALNIRVFSEIIQMTHPQGFNWTFTEETACCGCDTDACEALEQEEKEAVIASLLAKMQAHEFLSHFVEFELSGTETIVIKGKEQNMFKAKQGSFHDLYKHDLVIFTAKAYRGAPTTQDMVLGEDKCEQFYEFEVTQEALYPQGLPAQVRRVYARYVSNNMEQFRALPHNEELYKEFDADIKDDVVYDQIYLQAYTRQLPTWNDVVPQDFGVIIYTDPEYTQDIVDIIEAFGVEVENLNE